MGTLLRLARTRAQAGDPRGAVDACSQALALAAEPTPAEERPGARAAALAGLLSAEIDAGDLQAARSLIAAVEKAAELGPIEIRSLAFIEVGRARQALGDAPGAGAAFRNGLELAHADGSKALALLALQGLGRVARAEGRYEDAREMLTQALTRAISLHGEDALQVADVHNDLGMTCKLAGRFIDGRRHYERALTIFECALGSDSLDAATVHHNLGGIEHARGNFAAAEPHGRAALSIRRQLLGERHIAVAADRAALAAILDGLGSDVEAEAGYREAIAVFECAYGPWHHEVGVNLNNLAALRQRRGDTDCADRLYRRALRVKERTLGPEHPETALTMANLAVNHQVAGRPQAAEAEFLRALRPLRKLDPTHPWRRACVANYVALLRESARESEAVALEDAVGQVPK